MVLIKPNIRKAVALDKEEFVKAALLSPRRLKRALRSEYGHGDVTDKYYISVVDEIYKNNNGWMLQKINRCFIDPSSLEERSGGEIEILRYRHRGTELASVAMGASIGVACAGPIGMFVGGVSGYLLEHVANKLAMSASDTNDKRIGVLSPMINSVYMNNLSKVPDRQRIDL